MKARADLMVVAESLAAQARVEIDPPEMKPAPTPGGPPPPPRRMPDHDQAAKLAEGAKAALEAAALVDADPAPLIAALEGLVTKLGLADVEAILDVSGPVQAIEATTDFLEHCMREIAIGVAVQNGYVRLRELAEGLERDFSASDSDTARRIAARIHTGLEEAEEAITTAQGQQS